MEIIIQDRRTRAASAAERWREHFERDMSFTDPSRAKEKETYERLKALGVSPSPDDVNKVITDYYEQCWHAVEARASSSWRPTWFPAGGLITSWTEPTFSCDECGVKAGVMVCLSAGKDQDGDDLECYLCSSCVGKVVELLAATLKDGTT